MRAARGVGGGETSDAYAGIGTQSRRKPTCCKQATASTEKGARNATYDDNRHGGTTHFAALNNAGW